MRTHSFRFGRGRQGTVVKKDNKWLRENLVEPEQPIVLWICPEGDCDNTHAGELDQARAQHKAGKVRYIDQRICHVHGVQREPHAVIAMVKVELP